MNLKSPIPSNKSYRLLIVTLSEEWREREINTFACIMFKKVYHEELFQLFVSRKLFHGLFGASKFKG